MELDWKEMRVDVESHYKMNVVVYVRDDSGFDYNVTLEMDRREIQETMKKQNWQNLGDWFHVGNQGIEDAQVFDMGCGGDVDAIYKKT